MNTQSRWNLTHLERAASRRKRRRNRSWLAFFATLIIVALGLWFDIGWCVVGGIEELVRGIQAHPTSGHDIAFAVVRCCLAGVGVFAAIASSIFVWTWARN
jgi:hypothetical protein